MDEHPEVCPDLSVLDPNKVLVIFDLNGTLIHKFKYGGKKRPQVERLHELVESGAYQLAIWSSCMDKTVKRLLGELQLGDIFKITMGLCVCVQRPLSLGL